MHSNILAQTQIKIRFRNVFRTYTEVLNHGIMVRTRVQRVGSPPPHEHAVPSSLQQGVQPALARCVLTGPPPLVASSTPVTSGVYNDRSVFREHGYGHCLTRSIRPGKGWGMSVIINDRTIPMLCKIPITITRKLIVY